MIPFYIVFTLSVILCIVSIIPLVRNDHWTFRVFEFPRAQKWVLNLVFLAGLMVIHFLGSSSPLFWYIATALILNQLYLSYQIYPFTILAERQVHGNKDADKSGIKLVISNVYQDNRKSDLLLKLVKKYPADLMLFVETNKWWRDFLVEAIGRDFKYQVLQDMENTYGMLLFSRFELKDTEIRYLVKEEIPSIKTVISHPDVGNIRLFAIHPEPPVPNESPDSTERDGEMMLIAKESKKEKYPVIVAGDLNDVAWSYTTELFLKISGLLDPRRGRGMYNTFHAKYPFLRWPLDHIFCSDHFTLNRLRCLPFVGSDHFPVYVDFAIVKGKTNGQEKLEADADDHERADEKIEEVR